MHRFRSADTAALGVINVENARSPFDLVTPQRKLAVGAVVYMDAVSTLVFGNAARGIAHRQEFIDTLPREQYDTFADTHRK